MAAALGGAALFLLPRPSAIVAEVAAVAPPAAMAAPDRTDDPIRAPAPPPVAQAAPQPAAPAAMEATPAEPPKPQQAAVEAAPAASTADQGVAAEPAARAEMTAPALPAAPAAAQSVAAAPVGAPGDRAPAGAQDPAAASSDKAAIAAAVPEPAAKPRPSVPHIFAELRYYSDPTGARHAEVTLRHQWKHVLAGAPLRIVPGEARGQPIWRVVAGPLVSREHGARICAAVERSGRSCSVTVM